MGVRAAGQSAAFTHDANLNWTTKVWTFTAGGANTTLEFYSLDREGEKYGALLDNISVVSVAEFQKQSSARLIQTLSTSSSHSLYGLGTYWQESENDWTGVWTRRGNSNIFDAKWVKPGQPLSRATLIVRLYGNQVSVARTTVSPEKFRCQYEGKVAADGLTIDGSFTCDKYRGPFQWHAKIH
jgi:hypothetical protein